MKGRPEVKAVPERHRPSRVAAIPDEGGGHGEGCAGPGLRVARRPRARYLAPARLEDEEVEAERTGPDPRRPAF